MKILHYYWSQYYDIGQMGGGVQVYLKNIINEQSKRHNVYTLTGGIEYDISGKCKIKKNGRNSITEDYTIVNSPMLAPAKASFRELNLYIKDDKLAKILKKFLIEKGPFDVVHIHSLEGLTLSCLALKQYFPSTKYIITLHNYYPFCPQVNLWCENKYNCTDFCEGGKCIKCGSGLPSTNFVKKVYMLNTYLKRFSLYKAYSKFLNLGRKIFKAKYNTGKRIGDNPIQSYVYKDFRDKNIDYINKYVDVVICVSNRVKNISVGFGVNPQKCKKLYIGIEFAKKQLEKPAYIYKKSVFSIIYMGYMRRDKGFYFFCDCLKKMPEHLSKTVRVVIAARFDDIEAVKELYKIRNKFASLELYDGYNHENLHEIIQNINLGVVPVMWEDNLPQVAMELKSMGIPVLSSNLGGASELTNCSDFCFQAGNYNSFIEKIEKIMSEPTLLTRYYKEGVKLSTVEEHCIMLEKIYI